MNDLIEEYQEYQYVPHLQDYDETRWANMGILCKSAWLETWAKLDASFLALNLEWWRWN